MKTLLALAMLLFASVAFAASDSITIQASDITQTSTVQRDLGCTWDGNTDQIVVMGFYQSGATESYTMDQLSPTVAANGSNIVLIFDPSMMTMGSSSLSYVQVQYTTVQKNC